MLRAYCLILLVFAAQRSFTMRVSDPDKEDSDYAWKTRAALREYLNFLLGGLRREEVEIGVPSSGISGGGGNFLGQDDEPLPLFPRHRPQSFRLDGYGGSRGRDPDPNIRGLDPIYRRFPDQFFAGPQENDDAEKLQPELTEKQYNFAVPPSDPRFFQTPLPIQNFGDGDPQYDPMVTKREPDMVTEESGTAVNDLGTNDLLNFPPDEEGPQGEDVTAKLMDIDANKENIILIALVAGCSTGVVAGVALLIYGFIKLQRNAKAAADVEYPAYGVTGPNKESTPTGDRRLAHSAQMYHYQLTKQQIIAMESNRGGTGERRGSISEADSDDDNEEGDYTVYECPGLAPTGEMEVKNPLFQDDPTPATTNDAVDAEEPQDAEGAAAQQPETDKK